jgi:isoaspartyl peptidase/L-asparaginase-like protein (Ntn-hydrolase superfamily)
VVVELMRNGFSPDEACKEVVQRIIAKHEDLTGLQAGFIAINKFGETGGYSVYNGFNYALKTSTIETMVDVDHVKKYN